MKTWRDMIPLWHSGYVDEMLSKVDALRTTITIYPPPEQVFTAFELTPFDKVQVVLVGQDPYHGPGQAQGLAFSVPEGIRIPPSLRNIFKEITQDIYQGKVRPFSTDLTRWATQGVFLLNAALTVEAGKAASHKDLGWHTFTDEVIIQLSLKREHLVFLLWGRHAQSKRPLIDAGKHLILEATHPSPLSARNGFFGCKHFSQANAYLAMHGGTPIVW
ncbi:MAG: uracil-DNA glycosylase [Anaerolineae bacterium]|nr:uracil-DNA glycosylase [Anaerolineae bacterium]